MTFWKDSLLIGVSHIDGQHRKLIAAIDELMEACNKGQGRTTIGKTLDFVVSYTKEHFADEEKIQAQYGYPSMASHKLLHSRFIADISALQKDFEQNGPSVALTGKLNSALVGWLINHISVEDKKLGAFIQSKQEL